MRKGSRRVKFELQMAGEDKYDEEDPEVFDDVDDDDEEEEGKVVELLEVYRDISARINSEIQLLPPLLPFRFGNGLLMQYVANSPGIDDKLGIMEVGLLIALTSLGLHFTNVLLNYVKTYICALECVLLVVLFLYCIYYYTVIDTLNPSSPFYVADRIFYFSMVVSSIMFVSLIIGLIILVYLKHKKQRIDPDIGLLKQLTEICTPSTNLIPMGVANGLIALYIIQPPDANKDDKVFLDTLALTLGSISIFLSSLESIGKIAMMVALRDGQLDIDEKKTLSTLQLLKNTALVLQLILFCVMFAHCLVIYNFNWICPRNILIVCSIISGLIVIFAAIFAIIVLVFRHLDFEGSEDNVEEDGEDKDKDKKEDKKEEEEKDKKPKDGEEDD
ncbi:uncharacterized protein LOC111703628 isoform X2 [Eurytemora carolleeae]|uniref:uncharacterized protein LOC111703628 isoform X2 n=1 Tax=Eurytemora carolleeae TaxID=1294199 RepID=UPI000C775071|nr:uncharacterized protein LOC111703628 isoform X2 [Eurytemora carolleeae]|eukprot:XP_023331396.1 uncharacterized protein LOC111703628 isoform X2 [Eurytemora affinis]